MKEKTRICLDCNKEMPLTREFFTPHGCGKKGFRRHCKKCQKIRNTKNKPQCKVDSCTNIAKTLNSGLCGMHLQRLRRYGDVNFVTPKNVMAEHSREAKLKVKTAKKNTYKKLHNRHEHRVMAEILLGRTLKRGEVVHHKDKNKHNNQIENLMVFKNQSEHIKYHNSIDPHWGLKK